ncbi:uncharacterized protein LOC135470425 isoform X3 [Liolophura sinensis]|uniref:uncharacterized protein LOC135470425 isoform X3 n=1 Tax=Liolophura sinensis TaxID=3198878 RepID=UPI0031586B47
MKLSYLKGDFDAALKEAGGKLVVVDFFATWCGPCKAIAPKLKEWSEGEFSDLVFLKVDVDELDDLAAEYGVNAMPTFILFKNKEKVETVVGASEAKLREAINKNK